MRILTLNYEYPPIGGGGATVCQGLAEALVGLGHRIDVVTPTMAGLPDHEERNGVHIYRVPCWRRHQHYSTAAELLTTILPSYPKALELTGSHEYDLAHCHFVVPTGVVAYLLQRRIGLPYVLACHGSDVPGYDPDRFSLLHPLIAPFWRRIVDGSIATTSPSAFLEGLVKRDFDRTVEVIPNFFDARPIDRIPADRRRVLVVSRLVRRKGVDTLIDAMAGLPRDWELLVVGDGPCLPELRRQAAAQELRARFLGHVARDQLDELYGSAAIFALPSLQENFPMTLLEAMAAGCAVVTTRTEGCLEVAGDAAALIAPGSVDELRTTLGHLMGDEGACAALAHPTLDLLHGLGLDGMAKGFKVLHGSQQPGPPGVAWPPARLRSHCTSAEALRAPRPCGPAAPSGVHRGRRRSRRPRSRSHFLPKAGRQRLADIRSERWPASGWNRDRLQLQHPAGFVGICMQARSPARAALE